MSKVYGRREILRGATAVCAALLNGQRQPLTNALRITSREVELQVSIVSAHTFRLTVLRLWDGIVDSIPTDGSLVPRSWAEPVAPDGARLPFRWLSETDGWTFLFHLRFGLLDFTKNPCNFLPKAPGAPLPLNFFIGASPTPAIIMAEYATLTGNPELPPL